MADLSPFKAPQAKLEARESTNWFRIVVILGAITIVTEIICWFVIPAGTEVIAELFHSDEIASYKNLENIADVVATFLINVITGYVVARIFKSHPFLAVLPVVLITFTIFFTELGGIKCLGVCGYPLWYDILSAARYFTGHFLGVVIAIIFRRKPGIQA